MIISLVVVHALFAVSYSHAQLRPVRNTTAGMVAGYFHTEGDVVAEIFEAVPYAQPPVGHLRFEVDHLFSCCEYTVFCVSPAAIAGRTVGR